MTGKSFFVYAQKFSAGLCIFPLQSSALLFCHTQQTRNVKNALKLPYSNGKLEGKNNLIKVLQRIAFGFRNFENMRRRIFLYEENWQTKKPKKRKCRRKTA